MVNGEGSLIVPNITEGEYASREGVDYYCIARDNIGFDVATRSRSITVYYACKSLYIVKDNKPTTYGAVLVPVLSNQRAGKQSGL